MEQARREPPGLNTWDCKICRAHELDKTRGCLLSRPALHVRGLGRMSRREICTLLSWEDPLGTLGADGSAPELEDDQGRPICPVGLIVHDAAVRRIIAAEADAREYQAGLPATYWGVSAYRVLRSTRAEMQDAGERQRRAGAERIADLERRVAGARMERSS